jgi:hypothetical protein
VVAGHAAALDRATPPPAKIVNGTPTGDFPAVGILLAGGEFCTATLIGCETVLTAAHCVCDPSADTFAQCQRTNPPSPSEIFFLPQYAPRVGVRSVTVHPDYDFGRAGDLAVIKLQHPVTGITPMPFNSTAKPSVGTLGVVVGFGRTGGDPDVLPEVGIKRVGAIMTATCTGSVGGNPGIPAATHLCVDVLDRNDVGTCQGDSGGPLLVDTGAGDVIAGITSGGATDRSVLDCLPESLSFFTDVFRYRTFVAGQLGDDAGPCGDLPPVGAVETAVQSNSGSLSPGVNSFKTTVEVPPGVAVLRVNMNGELITPAGLNDFDLFVNFNAPASDQQNVCSDTNGIAYGACEITAPAAGTWHVAVDRLQGAGDFQLLTTEFGVERVTPCTGDCDGDGTVSIAEIVRSVTIAQGNPLTQCPAIDANGDGTARIDELVAAVAAALSGCA